MRGRKLLLIVTDGCAGLAAAIRTVSPHVLHQRCGVRKMRNILEHVRKRDYEAVKKGAQAICQAANRGQAEASFRRFRRRCEKVYPRPVQRLGTDLPEL